MSALLKTRLRFRRLMRMTAKEFHFRLRQQLWNRWEAFQCRAGFGSDSYNQGASVPETVPHRPINFFFTPAGLPSLVDVLRTRFPRTCDQVIGRAERVCTHRCDRLGYHDLDYDPPINWTLDPVNQKEAPLKTSYKIPYLDAEISGDSKIIWELNRHQHFLTLGKAYQLTHNEKFAREFSS